ncbi:hypothetical protein PGT21_050131 [Puccinia graminis f. sp. tritici]|uniref:Retrovirus-related Pol polyprotein from transposon TNT 1-94-like beta-barrel domain-containing protein n=1 Tax=Puccinia graminis f. sp. tritici TaxID=56615 RepID=A0A5B0Q293_PUCGR|nr:hypothetical protein PGT21_050131 [Puccinia graminis f. sp. tritici]
MAPSASTPATRSKDKDGEKEEKETYNVDKDTVNVPKFNGDNYPIWVRKIRMHLCARELEEFIDSPLKEDADEATKNKANRVCNILSHGIDDSIFTSTITEENEKQPFDIWTAIKDIYASDSMLSIFQVWNKWEDIQFENDMNEYINAMLESLSEFSSIGIKIPDEIISCGIIGRITKKRPLLMQTLFSDIAALSKPKMIIANLRDIGRHEKAMRKQIVPDNTASSTALATNLKRKPKPPKVYCKNGRHNPAADSHHPKSKCWTVHPEKREEHYAAKKAKPLTYHTTAGDNDPDLSSIRPAFAYHITKATTPRLPTVLDSGASNHMINNLDLFVDTTPTQITILTGGGAGELTAVARGTAKLTLEDGQTLILEEALYVPKLSRNLISMMQLMKHTINQHC